MLLYGPFTIANGAHNVFLNTLANLGVGGLAAFLALLVTAVVWLVRVWSGLDRERRVLAAGLAAALAAYLVQACFNTQAVSLSLCFWVLPGCFWRWTAPRRRRDDDGRRRVRSRPRVCTLPGRAGGGTGGRKAVTMNRSVRGISLLAAATLSVSLMAVAPVGAQGGVVLQCGAIITQDTVLGADIGPCGDIVSEPGHTPGGHGIVIGADGVDLNLNGHTIFGLGGDVVLHQAAGVKVDEHSDVTVFGGTVRGFFHGVQLINGARNTVSNVRSIDNTTGNGIVLQNQRDSRVAGNSVINSGGFGGISVFDGRAPDQLDDLPSANNVIQGNLVDQADNRVNTAGISLENGPGHRVVGNTVTRSSGDGINLRASSNPLPGSGHILPPVTKAVVWGNVVRGNGTNAAAITPQIAGIALQHNATTGLGADGNQILGNRVENNADHGIFVASRNNVIVGNTALGNAVHDLRDANLSPPCDNNTWRRNTFVTFNQPCVTG